MKIAIPFILMCWAFLMTMAGIALNAPLEISPTSNSALTIKHCHVGDMAIIRIDPADERDHLSSGWTFTTNAVLTLENLSMVPDGTNFLTIQTVCAGVTSAPVHVTLILKRTPPQPIVSARRITMVTPEPPIPWGMTVALPNAGNPKESYSDFTNRLESGKRRSQ